MASSFSLTSSLYEGRYLKLSCSQSKDIATNTSTISWTLTSAGGGNDYYATGPTTVTINGTEVYYKARVAWTDKIFPAAKGSTSGTITIKHDSYGSKSINVSLKTAIYTSTVSEYKDTWTLDAIAQPSQPSCITWPQTTQNVGNIGSAFTIHMNKQGAFTHYVYCKWGSKTVEIGKNVADNVSWTIPIDFTNDIPNSMSGTGTIYVDTYSGTAKIGTKSVSFTASVPSYTPTISNIALTGGNLLGGAYVQGKSTVTATITASTLYGATIKSYSSTVDGKTYTGNGFTSSVLSDGNKKVSVIVTDTRGKTATLDSDDFIVYAYAMPTITSFTVERQSDGSTVVAYLKGKVSPVGNKNTKSFNVTLNGVTQSITIDGYDVDDTTTFVDVPTDQTLIATARIADWYTAIEKAATLPTVAVTMDFHHSGKGIAFGKTSEKEAFECAMPAEFSKGLMASHLAKIDVYDQKDFNDLVYNTGYYPSFAAPNGAGCSNYPASKTGVLEVISYMSQNAETGNWFGFAYQTYRTHDGEIYMRSYYTSNGFTAWKKIQFA